MSGEPRDPAAEGSASTSDDATSREAPGEPRLNVLRTLLVLALGLLLVDAGRIPLLEPDEGRYAEIPREMVESGDYVTQRLNGLPFLEKPPLLAWSVAASYRLFGRSEAAARIPVKLASAGLVLLTLAFARKRLRPEDALSAALLVATSLLVFGLSRQTLTDPLLAFAVSAAAFAFAAFQEHEERGDRLRSRRALFALHAACGLAVLAKGLVGVLLPGAAIFVWAAVTGRWRTLLRTLAPVPMALFFAIALPWYLLAEQRTPGFLRYFIVNHHLLRFATTHHYRMGSPFYFAGVVAGGLLPWTPFLGRLRAVWPGRSRASWRDSGWTGFLVIWTAVVFLFFTASRSKLIPYIEPIWPALGVLVALGISRASGRGASFRGELRAVGVLTLLLFAAGAVMGFGQGWASRLGATAGACVALAGLLLLAVLCLGRAPRGVGLVPRIAAPWLVFLAGALLAYPAVSRFLTPWPILEVLETQRKPGDVVVQYKDFLRVVSYYGGGRTLLVEPGAAEVSDASQFDSDAARELLLSDDAFRALWFGPRRVFVVTPRETEAEIRALGLPSTVLLARDMRGKLALLSNSDR
jgi:4-amino-4-deoxy-L-arabinose transferase-like glycosyltransferase